MQDLAPISIQLDLSPDKTQRLLALQKIFSEVCNAISPIAKKNRCWNRVALHHLVYRSMRERFSQLGSQMICNAVYSVCRTYRMVCESPGSPFNVIVRSGGDLPLIKFLESTPVYFDRHTLSIKDNLLSMFTLDGRIRFAVNLDPIQIDRFASEKLREITLIHHQEIFQLTFTFDKTAVEQFKVADSIWPNHIVVLEEQLESAPLVYRAQSTNINNAREPR